MWTALLVCLLAADGVKLYEQGRFAEAETAFLQVLAGRPDDAGTRLYLAKTLIELGRIPDALAEIDKALAAKLGPEVEFQAGKIMRELAERRFGELERLAPDSAAVREFAGRRFELQAKLPEALREYRAAIAKEPARPGLHFLAGNILWRMRELEDAARELEAELSRSPHHGAANLRLGQVFLADNQIGRALPHLARAVEALPNSAEARREFGKALRDAGRTEEARAQWEAVARMNPDDDQAHYLLGNLYRQMGDNEGAQRELKRHRDILERRRKRD